MFCPNCGASNDESYNNCTMCGRYIADINKEILRKKESASDNSVNEYTDDKPLSSDIPATSKISLDIPNESNSVTEKRYGESIYRQNIKKPGEYLIFSLICAAFGSLSFGIAAIVFSAMTRAEFFAGNIKKAEIYSNKTKLFCIISLIIGVLKYIFIIGILLIFSNISYNTYYTPYMW